MSYISFLDGGFPNKMKIAKIIPIYKSVVINLLAIIALFQVICVKFFFFPKWSILNLSVEPPAQTILQNANIKKPC